MAEVAQELSRQSRHPQLMLWVVWLVTKADHKITDDEALLMQILVRLVRDEHHVVDEQLAHLVEINPAEVWRRMDAASGDLDGMIDVANRVATLDGAVNTLEAAVLAELQERIDRRKRTPSTST